MRLTQRIFLLIFITVSLSSLGNFFLTQYQEYELHINSEKILARTLIQSLRDTLAHDIIIENKLRVTNVLYKLKEHDNPVEYIYISKGIEHRIFAHSFRQGFPRYLINMNRTHKPGLNLTGKYQTQNGLIYEYSEDLIDGLDTTLHIGINQSEISEKLSRNNQTIIIISLIIIIITLLIGYYMSLQITSPLARLTQEITKFGLGEKVNFDFIKGNIPEIHLLASAFQNALEDRQHALERLRDREQNLEITLNSIGDAVIVTDADGNITRMNPVACELTGWPIEEARGKSVKSIFPIVDASTRNNIENPVEKVISSGETVYLSNHTTLISRDGTEYHIADSAAPIRDKNDVIQGMVLVFNDITESYRLRQVAAKSERDLQAIMDHSPTVIYIKDHEGRYTFINQQFTQLFHIERDDITGKTDHDLFPKEFADEFFRNDMSVINSGETIKVEETVPQNDSIHTYFSVKFPLYDNDEIYAICGISTDVTEKQQTEESLRRSQKMEAIGQLSGGIAHDFNNQLGVIIGYLDFLEDYTNEHEEPKKWVATATRATLRCMDLTRQLLAFSRRQGQGKSIVDLNSTLTELDSMIARSITPEVEIKYFLADKLWQTEIDPGEFQDTILNLVINARDAMPKGGKLIFETSNKNLDDDYARLNPDVTPGDYVQLMVSDTGTGMDSNTLDHIFEPFFTTKSEGKGTGLGMAMVYGFVKRYQGYIKIYSEVGVGTTMRLYFPRVAESEKQTIEHKKEAVALPTGNETILIVDDENDLLKLADKYLTSLGYHTRMAENAAQAMEILAQDDKIEILFSDVVMPGGMNGYELAKHATAQKKELKVLLTSGFTSDTIAHNGLARFSSHLLTKPYRKSDLAERIRMVLDEVLDET